MKIALIGHGAIAQHLARAAHQIGVDIGAVIARPGRGEAARASLHASLGEKIDVLEQFEPDAGIGLVVECAGHGGLVEHVPGILRLGVPVITVSLGALADDDIRGQLADSARAGGTQLHLVSGAVGSLDALKAARTGGLESVVYRGRKPPAGWRGSPAESVIDLDDITAAQTHFTGSARQASLKYPKNANVAAAIALAGLGFDATNVELIADPDISANIHEIEAIGTFGRFAFRIEGNALPDNPRTSALAAMSVVSKVAEQTEPLRQ